MSTQQQQPLSEVMDADGQQDSPRRVAAAAVDEPRAGRGERLLSAAVLLAIAFFAALGIGAPLVGEATFLGTDELVTLAPYDQLPRFAGERYANTMLDDTWDTGLPNTRLYADELREGRVAAWNPYISGGTALGATPNFGLSSPLAAPFYVLPAWLAPGYMKLLEIAVAVGGCWLFLRRLRLRPPAALLGGLAYASSAFLVVWTNFPHTRVAAFIPAVFWAVELIVARRRLFGGATLAVVMAAMVFGGFPAVLLYTLLTAAAYAVVRAFIVYRGRPPALIGTLAAAGAGVVGGLLLAAVQLLPWLGLMSTSYIEGRGQAPGDHLPVAALVTAVSPWALGTANPYDQPMWYLPVNIVEANSYVGAAVLLLAVAAVAMARRARAALPAGVWAFLVAACAAWLVLIYVGRAPLALAQKLPLLFADNYVGRGRSITGFIIAVLAAVGLHLLLERRGAGTRRWERPWAAAVWGAVGLIGVVAVLDGRRFAARGGAGRTSYLWQHLAIGAVYLAIAAACLAALWWGGTRRPLRIAAAIAIPALVTAQALTFVGPYWPRAPKNTFYPVTDVQAYLREHLADERFAGTWGATVMSADSHLRLRAATGHAFVDRPYGELVRTVPGSAALYPTYVNFYPTAAAAGAKALDRMAVRYFVTGAEGTVFGTKHPAPTDGTVSTIAPDSPVEGPVAGTGPLRAVEITPTETHAWAPGARIEVTVRDQSGREVARHDRRIVRTVAGTPWTIAVAAEDVPPAARLTATVTVRAKRPLAVEAQRGVPALSGVGAAADGLALVHAGSATIYERRGALPRLRWASSAVVEPDPARRLARLAAGDLRPDQVLLGSEPAGSAAGTGAPRPASAARTRITGQDTDTLTAEVTSSGDGYLVLADAIQHGWRVTVDGRSATLLPADHAFGAVAVPAGTHTVEFRYAGPYGSLGLWVSIAALVALLALAAFGLVRRGRRSDRGERNRGRHCAAAEPVGSVRQGAGGARLGVTAAPQPASHHRDTDHTHEG